MDTIVNSMTVYLKFLSLYMTYWVSSYCDAVPLQIQTWVSQPLLYSVWLTFIIWCYSWLSTFILCYSWLDYLVWFMTIVLQLLRISSHNKHTLALFTEITWQIFIQQTLKWSHCQYKEFELINSQYLFEIHKK